MRLTAILGVFFLLASAIHADQLPAAPPKTPAVQETITVTATRTEKRLSDTPSSVVVLPASTIATTAAATTDGILRQVPGFTLFRRSGSEVANPTSQGASLRGIGASGASRALVLDDGIPLNDPFGGWVYWSRVPRAAIGRIEVLRGGASDLYGSGAMGGVVQFIRRDTARPAVVVDASAGSMHTGLTSLFASAGQGSWRGSLAGDLYSTAGYVQVEPRSRGAVDGPATSRHIAFDGTVEHTDQESRRLFVRLSRFDETRNNGTPLQANDTTVNQLAAGFDTTAGGGATELRAFAGSQDYAQTFSAIAADRTSERLTVAQRVPATSGGATLQWSRGLAGRHALTSGIEFREVRGETDEQQFSTRGTTFLQAGGQQRAISAFLEDIVSVSAQLSVTAGLRYDAWQNFDAFRDSEQLASRKDSSFSPRLSLLYQASPRLALTASAYRAFRAPTLNELYRGFRVGNSVTLANEALGPERLSAVELGARLGGLRATLFDMNVDDTIANVTLASTPSLITRQRQNLGSTRTRGAELEAETRIGRQWRLSAGWMLSDAVVTQGDLTGRRLPQVPRSQATAQIAWSPMRLILAMQGRWSAMQFEDDRNQLPLRACFVADAFVSAPVHSSFALTLAAENLFGRRVETAATPVISLGPPRSVRVGFRYTH